MKILYTVILIALSTSLFSQKILEAPDFTIEDIDEDVYNLYDELNQGKTVFIYFFDINCGSCSDHIPAINNIWQTYGSNDDNVLVWGIEMYEEISSQMINLWSQQYGVEFNLFANGHNENVPEMYGITYTPQLHVICPNRTRTHIQYADYENFQNFVTDCENTISEQFTISDFAKYDSHGITLANPVAETVNITIYDYTGRTLLKQSIAPGENYRPVLSNTSSLYILDIRSKEKVYLQSKISLQ